MRGPTCSGGWRVAALLLGASWLVTLAVACGGGDDAVGPTPSAAHAAGGSSRAGAGAVVGAGTAAPLAQNAAATPAALRQPCADEPRQAAQLAVQSAALSAVQSAVQSATVPAHLRAPAMQDHGLSDEALKSPLGDQGASAAGVQLVDPLQTK